MPYTRATVDFDRLMIGLLSTAGELAGAHVTRAVDVDEINELPTVLQSGFNGHAVENGAWSLGWRWTLGLSLIVAEQGDTGEWADRVHVAVHAMEEQNRRIAGVGVVSVVEDDSMLTAGPSVLVADKLVRQYDGAWTVTVRPVHA